MAVKGMADRHFEGARDGGGHTVRMLENDELPPEHVELTKNMRLEVLDGSIAAFARMEAIGPMVWSR
jgi:hypothetical protein